MFFAFAPVSAFSTAKSIFNWFSSDSWFALAVAFSVCKSSICFFRSALSPADAFRVSNCLSRSPTCVFSPSTSVCKFLISVAAVPFAFSMSSPLIFITESACSLVSPKSSNCFLVISIPSFQIRFYTGLLPHDWLVLFGLRLTTRKKKDTRCRMPFLYATLPSSREIIRITMPFSLCTFSCAFYPPFWPHITAI